MSMTGQVIHISATDNEGGSGRSAYRIHQGLQKLGWQSRMLVGSKVTADPDVDTVYGNRRIMKWAGYFIDRGLRKIGAAYQWQPWATRLRRHPWLANTDVIQLYNLHGGFFPMPLLSELSQLAPLVWRLSDMWPMTGHCVYAGGCEKWRTGCHGCPAPRDYVELGIDTSSLLWRQKQRIYAKCNITVVAPSSWTERLAKESPLLGCFPVHRIPNGIDIELFRPIPRDTACEIMRLDPTVRRLLFVAHGLDNNPRKGGTILMEALHRLGHRSDVELLLAGVGGASWEDAGLPLPVRRAGYISDDRLMAALYSAADLIVVPSAVENLPNTLLEAMACGLPSVALNTGGMSDAVRNGITGILVEEADAAGLTSAIDRMLDNDSMRREMGYAARQMIENEFSFSVQAQKFAELYAGVIEQNRIEC